MRSASSPGPGHRAGVRDGAHPPQPCSSGTSPPPQPAQGPTPGTVPYGRDPRLQWGPQVGRGGPGTSGGGQLPYSPQSWAGRTAACSRMRSSHMPERGGGCHGTARLAARQSLAEPNRDTAGNGRVLQEAVSAHRGRVSRNRKGLWLEAKQREAGPPRTGAEISAHGRSFLPAP